MRNKSKNGPPLPPAPRPAPKTEPKPRRRRISPARPIRQIRILSLFARQPHLTEAAAHVLICPDARDILARAIAAECAPKVPDADRVMDAGEVLVGTEEFRRILL